MPAFYILDIIQKIARNAVTSSLSTFLSQAEHDKKELNIIFSPTYHTIVLCCTNSKSAGIIKILLRFDQLPLACPIASIVKFLFFHLTKI
jgi:hypothetical protein